MSSDGAHPSRLTAEDWVSAALDAISRGGLAAVAVEPLARSLGATKGSFYWHFRNRDTLITAALTAWEAGETVEVAKMLKPLPDAGSRLKVLMRAALDDRPGANVEAALLTDSSVPQVRAALDRATTARTAYLRDLFRELGATSPHQRATTAFALYLGLLHMRRSNSSQVPRDADLDHYVDSVCQWLAGPAGDEVQNGTRSRAARG